VNVGKIQEEGCIMLTFYEKNFKLKIDQRMQKINRGSYSWWLS